MTPRFQLVSVGARSSQPPPEMAPGATTRGPSLTPDLTPVTARPLAVILTGEPGAKPAGLGGRAHTSSAATQPFNQAASAA